MAKGTTLNSLEDLASAEIEIHRTVETIDPRDENIVNNRVFVWNFERADLEEFINYFRIYRGMQTNADSRQKLNSRLNGKINSMLNSFSVESYVLLLCSFCVLFIFLFYVYRMKAFIYLLPSLLSVMLTISVLGIIGWNISFFNLLSLFIVVGLSMDYTIFHLDTNARKNIKPVFYSFLTSFVSFGLLGFVDFYLVRVIGITICIGLGFSYIFSLFVFSDVFYSGNCVGNENLQSRKLEWFDIREQSVGRLRLLFLWWVYKVFRLVGLYFIVKIIFPFIYVFSGRARDASKKYRIILDEFCKIRKDEGGRLDFSVYDHIRNYALSLVDKFCCLCDDRRYFNFEVEESDASKSLLMNLRDGSKGVFFISSHLGNVEMMTDILPWWLREKGQNVGTRGLNAFMQMSHTNVFQQFLEQHRKDKNFRLWATEKLDFADIMSVYEELETGNLVLMAGDRVAAENPENVINVRILGKNCKLPLGAFKFAKMMKVPVYAVFVVRVKNGYKFCVEELNYLLPVIDLVDSYAKILEKYILAYPEQWYNFYNYFE